VVKNVLKLCIHNKQVFKPFQNLLNIASASHIISFVNLGVKKGLTAVLNFKNASLKQLI